MKWLIIIINGFKIIQKPCNLIKSRIICTINLYEIKKNHFTSGYFLSCSSLFSDHTNPKVVVIGGGLAGLTTAYRLNAQGVDVELFEARKRVGGRVLSVKYDGRIAELGGKSIADGGDAKTLFSLIDEFQLELTKVKVNIDISYFDGKSVTSVGNYINELKVDVNTLREKLEHLKNHSKTMADVIKAMVDETKPLYNFLSMRVGAYEGDVIDNLSSQYIDTLHHVILGGLSSTHRKYDDPSLIDLISLKEGNSTLPFKMAEALGDLVHLNKALESISKDETGRYVLGFSDGQKNMQIL